MITDRIDHITAIPESRLRTFLPAPRSVKIELTSKCNFHCGFCASRLRLRARRDMDRAFFERAIIDMRAAGVAELGLFYIGESMLCPWLPEAIEYAKKSVGFPYVFLTTNGAAAGPTMIKRCMEAGLDSLKWSFNHADEKQFHDITGCSPALLAFVKANIKEAFMIREEGGYQTGLYASSIQYDGEQQSKMAAAIAEIRPYVDEHYWLPLYSFGSLAAAQEKELGFMPTAGNQGRVGALRDPLPCWSAFTEGHVTAEGKLSACCFDAGDLWEMGDLTNESFMGAWNSSKFQALREAHLRKDVTGTPCQQCMAYRSR